MKPHYVYRNGKYLNFDREIAKIFRYKPTRSWIEKQILFCFIWLKCHLPSARRQHKPNIIL